MQDCAVLDVTSDKNYKEEQHMDLSEGTKDQRVTFSLKRLSGELT